MEVEFMTADTALPPCMPLPRAMLRLPISSTAKVMYARMLDIIFLSGIEDTNGILFIHFPIVELAAALARSTMTVKRSLNELEDAGLILRVRQGFGEPNKIYVLIPKKEDRRLPHTSCAMSLTTRTRTAVPVEWSRFGKCVRSMKNP